MLWKFDNWQLPRPDITGTNCSGKSKFGNYEANYPLDFGPRVFIINSKVIKHQLLDVLKKKYK